MTVTQLRPSVVTEEVARARAAVEAAAEVPMGSLEAGEVRHALGELAMLESQVTSLKLAVLAEADLRDAAEETGAADTACGDIVSRAAVAATATTRSAGRFAGRRLPSMRITSLGSDWMGLHSLAPPGLRVHRKVGPAAGAPEPCR